MATFEVGIVGHSKTNCLLKIVLPMMPLEQDCQFMLTWLLLGVLMMILKALMQVIYALCFIFQVTILTYICIIGAFYVMKRTTNFWSFQYIMYPADIAAGDAVGIGVAMSGVYALLTNWFDDDKATNAGSVYVYVRSGDSWSVQLKLFAPDALALDEFGVRPGMDDMYCLIGAHTSDAKGTDSGK